MWSNAGHASNASQYALVCCKCKCPTDYHYLPSPGYLLQTPPAADCLPAIVRWGNNASLCRLTLRRGGESRAGGVMSDTGAGQASLVTSIARSPAGVRVTAAVFSRFQQPRLEL